MGILGKTLHIKRAGGNQLSLQDRPAQALIWLGRSIASRKKIPQLSSGEQISTTRDIGRK